MEADPTPKGLGANSACLSSPSEPGCAGTSAPVTLIGRPDDAQRLAEIRCGRRRDRRDGIGGGQP